jgi:hypothetical protein
MRSDKQCRRAKYTGKKRLTEGINMEKNSASYSAKSEKHDEHKHLFGSGGKSDFIINMTPEGAQKLCGVYSMIAMILLAISSVPYYLSKQFEESDYMLMLHTEHNSMLSFAIMTCVILAGFIGLLMFMISCMKAGKGVP